MPLRETDPGFEIELCGKVNAAFNTKFEVFEYYLPLPLLLVDEYAEKPIPYNEPAEETIAISAHVSVRIRAFYEQIAAAYKGIEDPLVSFDIKIEIMPQRFDPMEPEWCNRRYHSRRLQLHDPKTLPGLPFVSRLTIRQGGTATPKPRQTYALCLPSCPCSALSTCWLFKSGIPPSCGSGPCPPPCR